MAEEIIRWRLRIFGSVQGVGFRYRAHHAAQALRVTGFVQNEWDGSVLMEAQGTQRQIDEMLTMIGRGTYVHMERIEKTRLAVDEAERGFHVRN